MMRRLFFLIVISLYPVLGITAGYYNTSFFKKTPSIRFTTAPQSLFASLCSSVVTIRSYVGSTLTNVPSPLTINLSATGGVTFFSDQNCNFPITDVTIATGANSASFYFLSNTVGSAVISTTTANYASINQTETLSTNPYIWTGGGGDANWGTATNWSGGSAPNSGSIAVFNGTCVTNCSATITANISIGGLRMATGYSGTITQNPGVTILVNNSFVQQAGSFIGGNSSITTYVDYSAIGGTFTSTSGTFTISRSMTMAGGISFNHNSGTVRFLNSALITPGSTQFNNVFFDGSGSQFSFSGTVRVNGNLALSDTHTSSGLMTGGEIDVKGNVTITNYGFRGTTNVKLTGSSNQIVTGSSVACLPSFEVASTGGTVSYVNGLKFRSHYTYTSGTIDASASPVTFNTEYNTLANIKVGSENFSDVTFTGFYGRYALTGTMNVNGTLVLDDGHSTVGPLDGGTILARGNIEGKNYGYKGTTVIKLATAGTQTITGISSSYFPSLEIDASGTVNLSGIVRVYSDFTYTSGTVNAGTSHVIFNNTYLGVSAQSPGTMEFNDVTYTGNYVTNTLTGTMKVNGNLTLADTSSSIGRIHSGTIQVKGNVTATNYGYLGTARIELVGPSPATISQVGGAASRLLTKPIINKDAGVTVTFLTPIYLNETGDTLTVTSGNVNMAGMNTAIRSSLSLNGNTLTKSGGVLTVNSAVVGTGSLHGGTINP